jgi:glyoxylate carboligase
MYWPHDECGCQRAPLVGSQYRRMGHDLATGRETGWRFYTVTDVEPIKHGQIFCRRCTIVSEGGRALRPYVQDLLRDYQAIGNVVPMQAARG